MILLSLPEIASYYSGVGQMPKSFLTISMVLTFSVFLLTSSEKMKKKGVRAFVSVFFLMVIMSVFHFEQGIPLLTLLCVFILMVSGVMAKPLPLDYIGKTFTKIAILYIIVLLWQLSRFNIDLGTILSRGYTWTEIFSYECLTGIWVIPLFSSYLNKRGETVAICLVLMDLIVQSLFLKRGILISISFAVLVIIYVAWKIGDKKIAKQIIFALLPIAIVAIYYIVNSSIASDVTAVSDAVSNRFSETAEDASGFDRFIEVRNYFDKEANIIDVILGKGFFSIQHGDHYYLHIGWANLIFKGGLFFFLLVLSIVPKAIRIIKNPLNYSKETIFAAMICMQFFLEFFYGNLMGFGPKLFFFFYSMIYVCNPVKVKKCVI